MSEDRDRCAACQTRMDVRDKFFVCALCLRALPPDIRREVLSTTGDTNHHARVAALRHLGAANPYDAREPRAAPVEARKCTHGPAYALKQANLLTGLEDTLCGKCGEVRYKVAG